MESTTPASAQDSSKPPSTTGATVDSQDPEQGNVEQPLDGDSSSSSSSISLEDDMADFCKELMLSSENEKFTLKYNPATLDVVLNSKSPSIISLDPLIRFVGQCTRHRWNSPSVFSLRVFEKPKYSFAAAINPKLKRTLCDSHFHVIVECNGIVTTVDPHGQNCIERFKFEKIISDWAVKNDDKSVKFVWDVQDSCEDFEDDDNAKSSPPNKKEKKEKKDKKPQKKKGCIVK